MKKLLLAAILGLGVFCVINLNAENSAKNQATKPANTQNLSDEQFEKLFFDCLDNENKNSCQRLTDSVLPSVEQCDEKTCNDIGRVYDIAQNYQQALKYYKKACELNDEWGCGNLANLYYAGWGVEQNFAEGFKFAKKACDLNNAQLCYNVGVSFDNGQGVKKNKSTAKKYFKKACDLGYKRACL